MKMKARRRPSKAEMAKLEAMLPDICAAYVRAEEKCLTDEHRAPLTPSPGGKECLGNGTWPGYQCECPDCDFYETCFPDWEGHKSV